MRLVLPGDVQVWVVGVTLPIVLLIAWVFASVARAILRGRARIGTAPAMVISILGMSVGLLLANLIYPDVDLWSWLTILLALGLSVLGVAGYAAVAARFQATPVVPIAELVGRGESDGVEFKSTARVNLHTGEKDERMEHVVAKTVCAFLNSDGGTLVVGVDDAGTPLGLDADLATMKAPDLDRYELWLRDFLTTTLGQNAATQVRVGFEDLTRGDASGPVCRIACGPSPRPVYLQAKGAGPEFYVRSGNSTRQLKVNEAADYVMHRWPLNLGSSIAAQLLAGVRFSGSR